jgi:hypothetical protein
MPGPHGVADVGPGPSPMLGSPKITDKILMVSMAGCNVAPSRNV